MDAGPWQARDLIAPFAVGAALVVYGAWRLVTLWRARRAASRRAGERVRRRDGRR
jgi:hypothetical protein